MEESCGKDEEELLWHVEDCQKAVRAGSRGETCKRWEQNDFVSMFRAPRQILVCATCSNFDEKKEEKNLEENKVFLHVEDRGREQGFWTGGRQEKRTRVLGT